MDKTSKYRNRKFNCKNCKNFYTPKCHKKIGTTEFCSVECRRYYFCHTKISKKCIFCKEKFECTLLQSKRALTCSQKCYDKYRYSTIIGVCKTCKKDVKRRTISIRKHGIFCSKSCFGIYKTYITEPKSYQDKKLRYNIFNNIKIKCEKCSISNINILTVHHIDHKKTNNNINNLMMLCYNCHYEIHHNDSVHLKDYINKLREAKNAFKAR